MMIWRNNKDLRFVENVHIRIDPFFAITFDAFSTGLHLLNGYCSITTFQKSKFISSCLCSNFTCASKPKHHSMYITTIDFANSVSMNYHSHQI